MKRKALFIGVNEYTDPEIRNLSCSVRDAISMHDIFEEIGYDTVCLENPSKDKVLHAVSTMTAGLSAGDQFLFYFAGHGFTDTGEHLLFCADDRHEMLRFHRAGIPFDLLEMETRTGGYDRSFLIDACQSDFFTGTRGDDVTTRDMVPIGDMVPSVDDAPGSFYVLRSCSKYEHAIEIESRNHGLFTLAMMDVLRHAKKFGVQLLFNDALRETIREKMDSIARAAGMTARQLPESASRGVQQVLMCGTEAMPGVSDAHSESDEDGREDVIGWQRMINELVSNVTIFPHVKMGDGFAQYVVADDVSAVLICLWPSRFDVNDVVSSLDKVREELKRTEPETLQEMVMYCEGGFPDNVAELRSRGILVMDKPQFVAFIVEYFSEKNIPLRQGKIHFALGEYDAAFKWFERYVKEGTSDPETQYMIGYMYDHGRGVERDKNEAASWYWKAANQGYDKAIEVLEKKTESEKARLEAEEDRLISEIQEFTNNLLSADCDEAMSSNKNRHFKGGGKAESVGSSVRVKDADNSTVVIGSSGHRDKPKKKRKWIMGVSLLLTFSVFGAALFMNAQGIELFGGDSQEAARFEELKGKGYFVLSFLGFKKAIWLSNRELEDYPHWLTDKKEGTWRIEDGYVLRTPGGAALSEVVWKPGWQKSPTVKAGDFEGTWLHRKKCPTCSGRKKLNISTDCLSCGGSGRITNTVRCQSCQGSGRRSQSYRCGFCNGAGRSNGSCRQCGGSGTSVCSNCSGSGRVVNPGAVVGGIVNLFGAAKGRGGRIPTGPQYINCSSCGGNGRIRCGGCGGRGTVYSSCLNCSGHGQITQSLSCNSCGGSGRTSSVGRCSHCKNGKVCQTQGCTECQGEGVVWR